MIEAGWTELFPRKSVEAESEDEQSLPNFAARESVSGKRISARAAKTLLRDGKTGVLKGFKSKSGQPFSGRLKLIDGKVSLDFDH